MPLATVFDNGVCDQTTRNTLGWELVGEYARACLDLDYRDFRLGRFAFQLRLIYLSCLKGSITQQETPTPNFTHTHTPQAPTCAPPSAKPRSPTTYCKAAPAPTPAPPAPTPPSPACPTPAPGTPPPSPALPLPPSPTAAHRSRRSPHDHPLLPPLTAPFPVSPQLSTPKNGAQKAATHSRAPWHQAVRLSWEN